MIVIVYAILLVFIPMIYVSNRSHKRGENVVPDCIGVFLLSWIWVAYVVWGRRFLFMLAVVVLCVGAVACIDYYIMTRSSLPERETLAHLQAAIDKANAHDREQATRAASFKSEVPTVVTVKPTMSEAEATAKWEAARKDAAQRAAESRARLEKDAPASQEIRADLAHKPSKIVEGDEGDAVADIPHVKPNLDALNALVPKPAPVRPPAVDAKQRQADQQYYEERDRKEKLWQLRLDTARASKREMEQHKPDAPVTRSSTAPGGVTVIEVVGSNDFAKWTARMKSLDAEIATCERGLKTLK